MKTKNIIKEYKTPIIITAYVLSVFIMYLGFYLPAKRRFANFRKEWIIYEKTLRDAGVINSLSPRIKLENNVDSLAKRLQNLEQLFPAQETDAINLISSLCYKLNIELVSITPTKKGIALDGNKKEISVGERKLEKTKLNLSLRTNFRNLVKYIEELRKLPTLITFEKIRLSKAERLAVESDNLKVELEIAVYTLLPLPI